MCGPQKIWRNKTDVRNMLLAGPCVHQHQKCVTTVYSGGARPVGNETCTYFKASTYVSVPPGNPNLPPNKHTFVARTNRDDDAFVTCRHRPPTKCVRRPTNTYMATSRLLIAQNESAISYGAPNWLAGEPRTYISQNPERSQNGTKTEPERNQNGARTEPECS